MNNLCLCAVLALIALARGDTTAEVTASSFCQRQPTSKVRCEEGSKLLDYRTTDGDQFNAILPLLQAADVQVLKLRGVRFADDRLSRRTFESFTSLVEFSCESCSIQTIDPDAFRAQSDTLRVLELKGNKKLSQFGTQQLVALRRLQVSGSKLSVVPQVNSPSLEELLMDGSSVFTQLNGTALQGYSRLTKVVFSGLKVQRVEKAHVAAMPISVRHLVLAGSGVQFVQAGAFDSLLLDTLNLAGNQLDTKSLQNALQNLTTLKRLEANSNEKITKLPANTFDPVRSSIESVDLTRCKLQSLAPGLFSNMPYLKNLKLRATSLATIDSGVFDGTSLSRLDLSYNSLTSSQWNPSNLPSSLTYLDVSHNRILFEEVTLGESHFGKSFALLQTVLIRNCSVQRVNEQAFGDMGSLRELDLANNRLDVFPDALCSRLARNVALLKLDLSGQGLGSSKFRLPAGKCASLQTVASLRLADLNLDVAQLLEAREFWSLTRLASLDLSGNQFDTMLKTNNMATFLQHFDSRNGIEQLTMDRSMLAGSLDLANVCPYLPRLQKLELNSNCLTAVTQSSVASCASLTALSLKNNSFGTFSDALRQELCTLPALKQVDLTQNTFSCSCTLTAFWIALDRHKYESGSTFANSASTVATQKCSVNGLDFLILNYTASCDLLNTSKSCVLFSNGNGKTKTAESASVNAHFASIASGKSTEDNSVALFVGIPAACVVSVAAAIIGFVVRKRRRSRRNNYRQAEVHEMMHMQLSIDSSNEDLPAVSLPVAAPQPNGRAAAPIARTAPFSEPLEAHSPQRRSTLLPDSHAYVKPSEARNSPQAQTSIPAQPAGHASSCSDETETVLSVETFVSPVAADQGEQEVENEADSFLDFSAQFVH